MNFAKLMMGSAMFIFGTLGLFVRAVPLPSSHIALIRGAVGCLCLCAAAATLGGGLSWKRVRPNLKYLIACGAGMGINWILFFESFRYTTVSTAIICYYLAPVIILALAPAVLHEKLSLRTVACVLASLAGLVCVAGGSGGTGSNDTLGIIYGVSAAATYAFIVLTNKFLKGVTPYETTSVQLGVAAAVLAPYVLSGGGLSFAGLSATALVCLALVCLVHTGLAYLMYFWSLVRLPSQTVAALSYIDPLSAIVLSALFLGEKMTPLQMLGGALILGATFVNEMRGKNGVTR
jgi:drug/metabolite transporter (DMT)-like permease